MRPDPSSFRRRVLVGVTGLAPQVVTETVYALALQRQPAFVPTEIHIVTSELGAKAASQSLLDGGDGQLGRLCNEYGLSPIRFDTDCIHVLTDGEGRPIGDLKTPEPQTMAADAITGLIQELTRDDSAALHVSLAGGRKSMSFYMGYAVSLFGRAQDRLSHVLVSEPFEEVKDFFYPPRIPRNMMTRNGNMVSTSEAHIVLAEIPFVQLRHYLPRELLLGGARFSDVVDAVGETVGPPTLVFDEATKRLQCSGVEVEMQHYPLALYLWLARRAARGETQNGAISLRNTDAAGFLSEYAQLVGLHSGDFANAEKLLESGFDENDFRSKVSLVKKALIRALGQYGAEPYLIARFGSRGRSSYGLTLSAADIRFKTD
jgi:CRISPR-associated protein (TIGR02584 family)